MDALAKIEPCAGLNPTRLFLCQRLEQDDKLRYRVGRLEPSTTCARVCIRVGHVRLDVQDRRTVEDIRVEDMQSKAIDPFETHGRQANGIRSMWRARGENTLAPRCAARREYLGPPTRIQVEPEHDPDPLPLIEVIECMLKIAARQQLNSSGSAGRGLRLASSLYPGCQLAA